MPSTVRLDHSISGADLDALRAGGTAPRPPTSRPGQGVNAWMLMDGGRLWLAALVLALLVVAVAAFGAWRDVRRQPVARYAPVEAVAVPVAAVPALDAVPDWATWLACPKPTYTPYTSARAMAAAIASAAQQGQPCYSRPYRSAADDAAWQAAHP